MDTTPYQPIDCALHDELLLRASRRHPVYILFLAADGPVRARTAVIVDVISRGGAEYLVLADGTTIRLDRLVEVDGIRFDDVFPPPNPLDRLEGFPHPHHGSPCRPRRPEHVQTPTHLPDPSGPSSSGSPR